MVVRPLSSQRSAAPRDLHSFPTRRSSDLHGHVQGSGDRSHLGAAPGSGGLHDQARIARSAGRQGAGDPVGVTGQLQPMTEPSAPPEVELKSLRDRPFELLAELVWRGRATTAQANPEASAGREWVGVALRMAGDLYLVAREETREVLEIGRAHV